MQSQAAVCKMVKLNFLHCEVLGHSAYFTDFVPSDFFEIDEISKFNSLPTVSRPIKNIQRRGNGNGTLADEIY